MAEPAPTNTGLHLWWRGWHICWYWTANELGYWEYVSYDDPGAGWQVAASRGPYFTAGDIQAVITAAGGMGAYAVASLQWLNKALADHFNKHPNLPPHTNDEPFTHTAMNEVLAEYFVPVALADHSAPAGQVHYPGTPMPPNVLIDPNG